MHKIQEKVDIKNGVKYKKNMIFTIYKFLHQL